MTRLKSALAALVLAGGMAGAADDWDERWSIAERNRSSPEGASYEKAFSGVLSTNYAPWLNECASKGAALGEGFDLLLAMDAKGKVVDTMAKPETALSRCFAGLARAKPFPKPPSSPYWWLAAVRFSSP